MITQEQIEHLRELEKAAPFAPWIPLYHNEDYGQGYGETTSYVKYGEELLKIGMSDTAKVNAQLIAAMRNALPGLLDELDRLNAIIAKRDKYASDDDGRCWHGYSGECDDYNAVKAERDALLSVVVTVCGSCGFRLNNCEMDVPDCAFRPWKGRTGKPEGFPDVEGVK